MKADVPKHEIEVLPVSRRNVAVGEGPLGRPVGSGLSLGDAERRFGLELDVLLHAFDGDDVGLDFGGGSDWEMVSAGTGWRGGEDVPTQLRVCVVLWKGRGQ